MPVPARCRQQNRQWQTTEGLQATSRRRLVILRPFCFAGCQPTRHRVSAPGAFCARLGSHRSTAPTRRPGRHRPPASPHFLPHAHWLQPPGFSETPAATDSRGTGRPAAAARREAAKRSTDFSGQVRPGSRRGEPGVRTASLHDTGAGGPPTPVGSTSTSGSDRAGRRGPGDISAGRGSGGKPLQSGAKPDCRQAGPG